jgi:SAM-dependent methyltransferase
MAYSESRLLEYRTFEIGALRAYFKPGLRVLEIGGGNGWQARQIQQWGCETSSIDIGANEWREQHFPVMPFDGANIPFGDSEFDIVYSSNVLEHVERLPELLAEVRRVLREGGHAINLMPTSAWRVWTSLSYYPYVFDKLLNSSASTSHRGASAAAPSHRSLLQQLFSPPHGVMPTAAHEVFTFSRSYWVRCLKRAGLPPHEDFPIGLFYTGHMILPSLSIPERQRLARIAGSACRAYISRAS